jgi:hypothetical protein
MESPFLVLVFHFDGLASLAVVVSNFSQRPIHQLDIRNIVVLRAFQLVLLYYFMLSEVLDVNTLYCQDKNIDILKGRPAHQFPDTRVDDWDTIAFRTCRIVAQVEGYRRGRMNSQ